MDFAYSVKINELRKQLNDFMDQYIYPNEQAYHEQIIASGDPHHHAEIIDELKKRQKGRDYGIFFCPMTNMAQG